MRPFAVRGQDLCQSDVNAAKIIGFEHRFNLAFWKMTFFGTLLYV
jgi:hypothetical protein